MRSGVQEGIVHSPDQQVPTAVKVIDARWAPCPGPLLEAKDAIRGLKRGEIVEIQTVDPEAGGDISAWAGKVGHEFLGVLHAGGYDRIFVRKKTP
jgi:tRNA 2-thiouridine synthesizing protein A